ncbi:MAG: DNA primase small subunit PriS [Candidatus Lokiarchaeota archaeon]|nr:DNA primase small subunit PriS [Candidatus Lokiarchaeota archaeon]
MHKRNEGVEPRMSEYVRALFQAYYRQVGVDALVPKDLTRREFGFIIPGKKGMVRHQAFLDPKDYKGFLVQNSPAHAYHSATLYNSPWKDRMDQKDYTGCDLIFDIDCDHIETPCKRDHDTWICKGCGGQGAGKAPEKCPKCGGNKFEDRSWLCDVCLDKAKTETRKLIDDFLVKDFGLPADSMEIYFSGQRGYHVHLERDAFRKMGADARREMADYITATGLSISTIGFLPMTKGIRGFTTADPGWAGKIARGLLEAISGMDAGRAISVPPKELELLRANKDVLKKRLLENDINWSLAGIGPGIWGHIIERLIEDLKCAIDVPVTIDVHRLIRAPATLHGKTGFVNCKLTRQQLDAFDPFTDAVVFKGNAEKIKTSSDVPRFRIEDRTYGPYKKDETDTVSIGAAVFLLCRNLCEVVA